MMNRVVPLQGAANSLRGTPQREATPLRVHFFCNAKSSLQQGVLTLGFVAFQLMSKS